VWRVSSHSVIATPASANATGIVFSRITEIVFGTPSLPPAPLPA
jgi:hypothetical protein